jgi:dephospho-CoA kinase
MRVLVVGLTGGIASGKSTVLGMFQSLGAEVLSADNVAREILRPGGEAYLPVIQAFGSSFVRPDGEIDRAALAHLIFTDPQTRKRLEALTHPLILNRLADDIRSLCARPASTPIVVEIPLLFEVNVRHLVHKVVVVAVEHKTQFARLKQRTQWLDGQVEAAISSQMPLSQKLPLADWVIWNDNPLQETCQQVRNVWEEIQVAAKEDYICR